jgi:hypothetical protein
MYFSEGFPAEWIETETTDGEKCWNHYNVKPDDKNIDKICKVWHDYGMKMIQAERFGQTDEMKTTYWKSARDQIKELMELRNEYVV